MVTKRSGINSSKFVIILILLSLTTIIGCDGDDWSFDLFGGDSVNGDDNNNNNSNGNGDDDNSIGLFVVSVPEDSISDEFPAVIFSAITDDPKCNKPVALFSSFDDGSKIEIAELTGVISCNGTGDVFKVSPNGKLVAYLSEEKSQGDTETRISELSSNDVDVIEFDWSPDSSRIAYLVDDESDDRVALYTNLAEGGENRKVSGSLPLGGEVEAFEWSPDSSLLAYTADQNNLNEFELFTTPPNKRDPVKVSGNVSPNRGDVTKFSWSPGGSRIAYLSDQRLADFFQLFTSRPRRSEDPDRISEDVNVLQFAWAPDEIDRSLAYSSGRNIYTARPNGDDNERVTPDLTDGGKISDFSWAPNSTRIAYLADRESDEVFELSTVEPDGNDDLRISGDLTDGGDVTDFSWAPNSARIAYLADQDTDEVFELFSAEPDDNDDLRISGDLTDDDDVTDFSWAPNSQRIAYLANQRAVGAVELFSASPDGEENDKVSGDLVIGGNVGEFIWAPDSSGIGYIADKLTDEVFELFESTPDGAETATLSGSFAEDEDGDVLFFEWVP